jgi:peptidoglycan hydrolase-like protein with peptidoglycan-binding domain
MMKFGDVTLRKTTDFSFSDPHVAELQDFLGIKADGKFGSGTEAAVIEYQSKNGLTPDGVVGPKTFASILGAIAEGKTAKTSPSPVPPKVVEQVKHTIATVKTAGAASVPQPVKDFWDNLSQTGKLVTSMLGLIGVMAIAGMFGKKK